MKIGFGFGLLFGAGLAQFIIALVVPGGHVPERIWLGFVMTFGAIITSASGRE